MANVYVYNATGSTLELTLNGASPGSISGTTTSPYTPNYLEIGLVAADFPQAEFGSENKLLCAFLGIANAMEYDLNIQDATQDLQLYVFYTYIALSRNGALTGSVGDQTDVPFAGTQSDGAN